MRSEFISDAALDSLLAIYERERVLFAAAFAHDRHNGRAGLRKLARAHGIDPTL